MIQRSLALFLLIMVSPIFFFITLSILIEDSFPVLYKQKRPGQNHQLFDFYKFRTMKKNTPEVATHLLENPVKYLLKIGPFLRRFSLDELPNLINVVKGDIGFVGPRPALFNQADLISLRETYGIDKLKPGITGWAQINGRDEISIDEKVLLEKYYLENRSLWLDIRIIHLTIKNSLIGRGVSH